MRGVVLFLLCLFVLLVLSNVFLLLPYFFFALQLPFLNRGEPCLGISVRRHTMIALDDCGYNHPLFDNFLMSVLGTRL